MTREQSPKKVAKPRRRPYQRVDRALGQVPVVLQVAQQSETPRLLTPLQLAKFLQVHPNTIRRHMKKLPHIPITENRVRFDPNDVVTYLKAEADKKKAAKKP